jgi:hypothetical protein
MRVALGVTCRPAPTCNGHSINGLIEVLAAYAAQQMTYLK